MRQLRQFLGVEHLLVEGDGPIEISHGELKVVNVLDRRRRGGRFGNGTCGLGAALLITHFRLLIILELSRTVPARQNGERIPKGLPNAAPRKHPGNPPSSASAARPAAGCRTPAR